MLVKIWTIIWKTLMWFIIISVFSVIIFRWVPIPVTPLMLIRCAEQKMTGKPLKLKKDWVSLSGISPNLQLAVVCSEDQNFVKHYGLDFDAIEKAIKHNEHSKHKRGASTISQQTAKNVFLWDGRSWIRKGFEVYFTFLIETFWNKQRIMEVYLNVIEMGDGIYGAEAAAHTYFNEPAKQLTRPQAALIAAVLPNPRVFNAGRPSAYIRFRQSWILHQMLLWGYELDYEGNDEGVKK